MKISGLYIVKNGEADIARSIKSIAGVCDEIVVVDTGSTDRTVEIVKELGATVYHFDWIDDFSAARNFALSKVKSELVIFIDSDEWFPEPLGAGDRAFLLDLVKQDYSIFSVLRSEIDCGVVTNPRYNTRMLRGDIGLEYVGSIHETVSKADNVFYLPERFLLHHSGYDGDLGAEKARRNLLLLKKQIEIEKNPRIKLALCFYLARETRYIGDYQETYKHINTFFELWNKTSKNVRPLNIGISAYDLAGKFYTEADSQSISDDTFFTHCRNFLRDVPGHPAAYYSLACYYFKRHSNYVNALDAISRVEEAVKKYNIEDYPNDYVGEREPFSNSMMLKGNILFDMNRRDEAFDCYASIMKLMQPDPGFLRRILNLINGQPAEDTIAFLSAIPPVVTLDYIEMVLSQLLYFPAMRDVYMYFAVQHLKLSQTQSDISAIASLLSGGSALSVVETGNALAANDAVAAGSLHLLAVLTSDEKSVFDVMHKWPEDVRIFESFRTGVYQETVTAFELAVLRRAFPAVIFIDNAKAKEKLFSFVSGFRFIFAHMILSYCNSSGNYGELLPYIDVDDEKLETENRAVFLMLMGRAFRTVGDYRSAERHLKDSFTLNPGSTQTYSELGVLASVEPALARGIYSFVMKFREVEGKNVGNEPIDSVLKIR